MQDCNVFFYLLHVFFCCFSFLNPHVTSAGGWNQYKWLVENNSCATETKMPLWTAALYIFLFVFFFSQGISRCTGYISKVPHETQEVATFERDFTTISNTPSPRARPRSISRVSMFSDVLFVKGCYCVLLFRLLRFESMAKLLVFFFSFLQTLVMLSSSTSWDVREERGRRRGRRC